MFSKVANKFSRGLDFITECTEELLLGLFSLRNVLFPYRGLPSQNLSGTLSPGIGNLTNLQSV